MRDKPLRLIQDRARTERLLQAQRVRLVPLAEIARGFRIFFIRSIRPLSVCLPAPEDAFTAGFALGTGPRDMSLSKVCFSDGLIEVGAGKMLSKQEMIARWSFMPDINGYSHGSPLSSSPASATEVLQPRFPDP